MRAAQVVPPPASGLTEWLRSCPDHDWFVEIESESTVRLGYGAWQETAYLFLLAGERAPSA
jgi:hypothetical protein